MANLTSPLVPAKRTRPGMVDYGISTSEQGLMSWEWADEQLTKSRNYWIVSTRPDGKPHAAPVWGVWLNGRLYFGSATSSRKARNIAHQPEIVVHLESGDDTVILEGTAAVLKTPDKTLMTQVADAYAAKYDYRPDMEDPNSPIFVFTPNTALTWTESDFPNTATRWLYE